MAARMQIANVKQKSSSILGLHRSARQKGALDFGLHDILIYDMKSRGGKYLENEKGENNWRRKIQLIGGEEKQRRKREENSYEDGKIVAGWM